MAPASQTPALTEHAERRTVRQADLWYAVPTYGSLAMIGHFAEELAGGHRAGHGTVATQVEPGPEGTLRRVKPVDPSFLNWPALPVTLADTIVPDFP